MSGHPKKRMAFSMIEVLVVLGLLALLFAFLVPLAQWVRVNAARTQGINNLKQQGLAIHGFHDVFKKLPFNGAAGSKADPKTPGSGSWAYQILPFVEQAPAFKNPDKAMELIIGVYTCPTRGRLFTTEGKFKGPVTDYAMNTWLNDNKNGSLSAPDRPATLINITDGTSNTILLGQLSLRTTEYQARDAAEGRESFLFGGTSGTGRNGFKHLQDGTDIDPTNRFGSPFREGTVFCMGDGSVRTVAFSVGLEIPLNPDDGKPLPPDFDR